MIHFLFDLASMHQYLQCFLIVWSTYIHVSTSDIPIRTPTGLICWYNADMVLFSHQYLHSEMHMCVDWSAH